MPCGSTRAPLRHSGRGPHRDVLVRVEIDTSIVVLKESINLCVQAGGLPQSSVFGAQHSKGSCAALYMHQAHDCVGAWSDHEGGYDSPLITRLACGQRLVRRDFPRLHLPKRPHAVRGRDCRIDGRHQIHLHPRIHL